MSRASRLLSITLLGMLVTLSLIGSLPGASAATSETLLCSEAMSSEVYVHERWIWDDAHDKTIADHYSSAPSVIHCETNVSGSGTSIAREIWLFDLSLIDHASNITNVNLVIPIDNAGSTEGSADFIVQLLDISESTGVPSFFDINKYYGNLGSFTAAAGSVNVTLDANQVKELAGGWLRLVIREKAHDWADTTGGMTDGDGVWFTMNDLDTIQLYIVYDGTTAGILGENDNTLRMVFVVLFFIVPGIAGFLFPRIGLIAGFVIIALVLMTSYSSFIVTALIIFANSGLALWRGD